jgi:hypothetical protein
MAYILLFAEIILLPGKPLGLHEAVSGTWGKSNIELYDLLSWPPPITIPSQVWTRDEMVVRQLYSRAEHDKASCLRPVFN